MKYVSIDIETTGLDSVLHKVLSIGAIIEDTNNPLPYDELPKFHVAILHNELVGSPYAINMNRNLIESIVQYQTAEDQDEKNDLIQMTGMHFLPEDQVVEAFFHFLHDNGMSGIDLKTMMGQTVKIVNQRTYPQLSSNIKPSSISVAGKNFGTFDKLFLERLPRWKQAIRIKQRIIDPSILFVDWKTDDAMPSLDECKKRANIPGKVTHNALEDAWDVVQILRKNY
jgi:DNA polymerase III epsilon subunit-like protein